MKGTVLFFSFAGNRRLLVGRLAGLPREMGRRVLLTELAEVCDSDLSEADVVLIGSLT